MIRILCVVTASVFISAPAIAQEWAATIGVHQTTADSNESGGSVDGKLNYKAGALLGFDLVENTRFRTGFIYNQRHIERTSAARDKYEYNFAYFDIPANLQYNINEMVGFFGGLVIAVNVVDDVEAPANIRITDGDIDAERMIPILNLGVNLMFNDMIGFDFYYERGMGRFAKNLENHSTFGGSFIYWF